MRSSPDLLAMMQLCDNKGCWLKDLDDVPADELPYWGAYFDWLDKKRKREEIRSRSKAGRH